MRRDDHVDCRERGFEGRAGAFGPAGSVPRGAHVVDWTVSILSDESMWDIIPCICGGASLGGADSCGVVHVLRSVHRPNARPRRRAHRQARRAPPRRVRVRAAAACSKRRRAKRRRIRGHLGVLPRPRSDARARGAGEERRVVRVVLRARWVRPRPSAAPDHLPRRRRRLREGHRECRELQATEEEVIRRSRSGRRTLVVCNI